jgi:D-alanyl-D-alanine carboxypeptidase/D-alanyl-D-alanine-endopeptidase (penicillin-binding protein 4)
LPGDVVPAQVRTLSAPDVEALVREARLGGKIGFAVADARTGRFLEGREQGDTMPPASVAKAITSLYALETLGAGYRFSTRLIATGPVQGGMIQGDLILAGSGDPTLATDQLAGMAATLAQRGVRGVTGRFRVYGGALPYVRQIDPDQPDHVGYNPSVSGLNLNFNRVYFEWKQAQDGYQVSMDARSERVRPAVTVARMSIANRSAPVYTYTDRNGVDDWTVAGGALGTGGSRWLPVRRPADYTGEVFQVLAAAQGIRLPRAEAAQSLQGTVLVEQLSDDLGTVLVDMLKWSTNLTAEVLGLSASIRRGAQPGNLAASGRRMGDWLADRIGVNGERFVDHSGLGGDSRISPDHMVRALVSAGAEGPLRRMMKRIDMKDAGGNTIRNHPAQVVAKTGTLNFVSALAGYVQTPSNAVLAFSIFSADLSRRRGLTDDEMERPEGGRGWTGRARHLQQQLIERWTTLYGS